MSTTKANPTKAAAEAVKLAHYSPAIPYVEAGQNARNPGLGLDCQGLVEVAITLAGGSVSYPGSNAMFRASKRIGQVFRYDAEKLRPGMCVYILKQDGNEPAKYQGDGVGNCSHVGMGVCLSQDEWTVEASSSAGRVRSASKLYAQRIWTHMGWLPEVDYQSCCANTSAPTPPSSPTPPPPLPAPMPVPPPSYVEVPGGITQVNPREPSAFTELEDDNGFEQMLPEEGGAAEHSEYPYEVVVNATSLNLRRDPNKQGALRGRAEHGETLTITDTITDENGTLWGKTKTRGCDGRMIGCWGQLQFTSPVYG